MLGIGLRRWWVGEAEGVQGAVSPGVRAPEDCRPSEEDPEVPASTRDDVLFIHAGMYEESRGAPYNDKGDLTSLRRHERVLQVDMQLERTPKLPDRTPPNSRNSPLHD